MATELKINMGNVRYDEERKQILADFMFNENIQEITLLSVGVYNGKYYSESTLKTFVKDYNDKLKKKEMKEWE